jgi:hypothetical protein
MKPPGALSKDELLALVKPGKVIYKVFRKYDARIIGQISKMVCSGEVNHTRVLSTPSERQSLWFTNWFSQDRTKVGSGHLFTNYFHALAYSLKLKAKHGKTQSEERTGMEGAE